LTKKLTVKLKAWILLILLSIIWGGSYFLIKNALSDSEGNVRLEPFQLGALRMTFASLALLPFFFKQANQIKRRHIKFLLIAGFCGNGLPAFLFSYAQINLDSAITGMLNSTTPIFALLISTLIFGFKLKWNHIAGITIGVIGTGLIVSSKLQGIEITQNEIVPFLLVIAATLCYAISLNTIRYTLSDLRPITITSASFLMVGIPCLLYLLFTGFPSEVMSSSLKLEGVGFVAILAVVGTALAVFLFNNVIQMTSAVFASSVTYFMPVVATLLGLLSGEVVTFIQYAGLGILVAGVILINKK